MRMAKFSCINCQTGEQLADIFTKELPREKFCYLRESIGVIKQMHYGGVLELMHQCLVFRNCLLVFQEVSLEFRSTCI